jgi:hypothetical protein
MGRPDGMSSIARFTGGGRRTWKVAVPGATAAF